MTIMFQALSLRRVMTLYSTIPVTQSQTRLTDMKFYMSFEFWKNIYLIHYIRIILPQKSRCAPATFQTGIFRPNGELFGVVSAVGWKRF